MVEQGQAQADVALPPRKRLLAGLKQQNGWIPGSSPSPSPSSTLQAPPTPASAVDAVDELPLQSGLPSSPGQTTECSNCGVKESHDWKKVRLGDVSMLLCTVCGDRVLKKKYCPHCNFVYQEDVDLTDEEKWLSCTSCNRRVHAACEEKINGPFSGNKPFLCMECSSDRPLPNGAVLTRARTSGGRQGANTVGGSRGVSPRMEAVLGLRPSRPDHVDVVDLRPPTKKPRTGSLRDGIARSRENRARMDGIGTSFAVHSKKDASSPLALDGGLGYEQENRQRHGGCRKGFMAPLPAPSSRGKGSSSSPLPPLPAPAPPLPERNVLEAAAAAAKAVAETAVSAAAAAKAAAVAKAAIAAKAAAAAKAALDVAAKAARSEVRARAILRKYGNRFERELHSHRKAGVIGGGRQGPVEVVRAEQTVKLENMIHVDREPVLCEELERLDSHRVESMEGGGKGDIECNAELPGVNDQVLKQPMPITGEEKRVRKESADLQPVDNESEAKVVKEEQQQGQEFCGKRAREEKGASRAREEKGRKRMREDNAEKRAGEVRSVRHEGLSEREVVWESKSAGTKKRGNHVSGETKKGADLNQERHLFGREPGERTPSSDKCERQGPQHERKDAKQVKVIDRERKISRDDGREKKPGLDERYEKGAVERKSSVANGDNKSAEKSTMKDDKEKVSKSDKGEDKITRSDKGEEKMARNEKAEEKTAKSEKGEEKVARSGKGEEKMARSEKGGEKMLQGEREEKLVERELKEKPVHDRPKFKAKRVEKVEGRRFKEETQSKKPVTEDGKRALKDVIIPGSVKGSIPQLAQPKSASAPKQFLANGGDGRSNNLSAGMQRSSAALDDEELARQLHRAMNSSPRISGVDLPARRRGRLEKQLLSAASRQDVGPPQQQCKASLSRARCGLVRERSHVPGREVKRPDNTIPKPTSESEEFVKQQASKDGPAEATNGARLDVEHVPCVVVEKAEKKGLNGASGGWSVTNGGRADSPVDAAVAEVAGNKGGGEENGPNAAMAALLNEVLKASPEEEVHLVESGRITERNALEEKRKLSLEYVKKALATPEMTLPNGGILEKVNGMNGSRGNGYEKAGGEKLTADVKFKKTFALGKLRPVGVGDVDGNVESSIQSRVTVQTAGGPSPHYG